MPKLIFSAGQALGESAGQIARRISLHNLTKVNPNLTNLNPNLGQTDVSNFSYGGRPTLRFSKGGEIQLSKCLRR
jgi:hypothetical protein